MSTYKPSVGDWLVFEGYYCRVTSVDDDGFELVEPISECREFVRFADLVQYSPEEWDEKDEMLRRWTPDHRTN